MTDTSCRPTDPAAQGQDGLDAIRWRRPGGFLHTARLGPGLLHERLWEVDPFRRGSRYQNRLNQHGLYFWAGTGEHVWYEFALELACLVALDQAGLVARVAAQPFELVFRRGVSAKRHVPDFFAVHAGGDQVVYGVKPAARINQRAADQFAQTVRVCAAVGWRHEVLCGPGRVRAGNLAFVRPARLARAHPDGALCARLLGVFASGRPIGAGA